MTAFINQKIAQTTPFPRCQHLSNVLEDVGLHSPYVVSVLHTGAKTLVSPDSVFVHCEKCEGVRRHQKTASDFFHIGDQISYYHLVYTCTNCTSTQKLFTVHVVRDLSGNSGLCKKVYQDPPFGSPIPKRLFRVIGEENRDFFLQARRAIGRGLGIGAYAYYRRIVENTKFELIDSVLEVAEKTNAPVPQIELLKRAKTETQFSKAMEMLSDVGAIPPTLLIEGQHNPLSLLHDLLSDGIHALSDAECLQRAKEAEVVLFEMADRMQATLTERKSVKDALASIMKRKGGGEP